MSEDKGKNWTRNWIGFIQQAAASATEVLSDGELRRKAGSKIVDGARAGVKGLQGGLQGLDLVARNLVNNVGGGLQQGRRGVQGVLERAQMRLEQARLLRALQLEKDMPVDIQIGFHVYEGAYQEIRSRYWMVLVTNPALAKPFQELGRFPDIGEFDPELRHQESIERAAQAAGTEASSSDEPDLSIFVTKPKPRPSAPTDEADDSALAELLGQHERQPESSRGDDDSQIPDISDLQPRLSGSFATVRQSDSAPNSPHHPMLRGGEALESRMHVGSASDDPSQTAEIMTDIPLHGSGHLAPGTFGERLTDESEDDESTGLLTSKSRAREEDEWQVVDKLDPLVESTFVGPTSLAHSSSSTVTRLSPPPRRAVAECSTAPGRHPHAANAEGDNTESDAISTLQSSAGCTTPKAEDKEERARLKKAAQALAGKRLHDATENLKAAMSALEWPVTEVKDVSSRYHILLQMTVGQEDVEEIIRRDIHRTFPEHPHFLLGQGQESLYNVLKAYSVTDLVVGYCQGMAFVAGILLMYMPEQLAFKIFCELMSADGPNIRRYYLPGLDDLKLEMAKFEWLLERHHPRLFQHLQTNGVPCVLYASQWLLTIFACPFPVDFTARIIDIMLLERSDHIVMQTAMAIMAECEDSLLKLDDFEDIITYLKTEPCEWANDKLQGLISAAYLSSVSDSEIQLANEVVTMERVERMMAKPAGRPSQDAQVNGVESTATPERAPSAEAATPEDRSARKSLVELDNDMIALVMEQEIENLKWAGPSREHSLIDADVPFLREAARTASLHLHKSSLG